MKALLALFIVVLPLASEWPAVRYIRVAEGLRTPVDIQSPKDGSGRLFIVEQVGRIRIWRKGVLLERPFLDLTGRVVCCGERGLLGLAFPPGFAEKKHFYVNYTEGRGATVRDLRTVVSRFKVSDHADVADPASEERLLVFDQPYDNHNGGGLVFGPDGFLYIGTGDGGSANDPQGYGQNTNTLLGKMLRVDVESGASPYRVPATNPFAGREGYRPEIWALGLRNPWRYSFDRQTGDLWIADVGQNRAEEIDFQPGDSKGGENYGWATMEGLQCLRPGCTTTGLVPPVHEYPRSVGASVTGGFVYRGSLFPTWRGSYLFADYVSGRLFALQRTTTGVETRELPETRFPISTFGEDEAGELYVARYDQGEIYRIAATAPVVPAGAVVNAASYQPGLVAGSLATVFGVGVSGRPGIHRAETTPLEGTLDGTTVLVDDVRAPLYAVANFGGIEQVNFQVPWELAGRSRVQVVVVRGANRSIAVEVDVLAAQPGIYAVAEDRGVLVAYANGLGAVDNTPASGRPAPDTPLARVRGTVTATVGGRPATVLFAGLSPRFVGLYQVNVQPPAGLPAGQHELVLSIDGASSPPLAVTTR